MSNIEVVTDWNGTVRHLKDGILHRDGDLPAFIKLPNKHSSEELIQYFIDGKLHRIGGPARISKHSDRKITEEEWHENGALHRIGEPARIYDCESYKTIAYYERGKRNRVDGPAVITEYKSSYWGGASLQHEYYQHDLLHRLDGPAIERFPITSYSNQFYIFGKRVNKKAFLKAAQYPETSGVPYSEFQIFQAKSGSDWAKILVDIDGIKYPLKDLWAKKY